MDSCWLWLGGTQDGYGRLRYAGKKILAHRLSWEMHFGKIPEGLWVLHKCDVRNCIRPEHLFLGTNQDNVDDKMRKKRYYSFAQTNCKNGHPLVKTNVKGRNRICKICALAASARYRAKNV